MLLSSEFARLIKFVDKRSISEYVEDEEFTNSLV